MDEPWLFGQEKKLPEPVKKSYIYPENTDLKIKSSEISNI
jgi:hypothetical protein